MIEVKSHDSITFAEWILYNWISVTTFSDKQPEYIRGHLRPLDEAMRLAGGSIKDLRPYMRDLEKQSE